MIESKGNNIILEESQLKDKNLTYSDYMNDFKQNIENGQITNFESLKTNLLFFYTDIFPPLLPKQVSLKILIINSCEFFLLQEVEVCFTDLITMIQHSIPEKSIEINNLQSLNKEHFFEHFVLNYK